MAEGKAFTPGRARPGLLRRLRRRMFRAIPLVVWCGAIAVILYLGDTRRPPAPYPGMAQVVRYTITAPAQAQLLALEVKEQELVEANQLVGVLDSADLRLRLERSRAEIARLQAEADRETALIRLAEEERRTGREMDLRRFRRDRESFQLDVLDKWAEIQEAKIRLVALADTLRRTSILAKEDYDSQAQLIDAQANHDSLAQRIKDDEAILRERQSRLANAEKRLADYLMVNPAEAARPVDAAAPLHWAVKAQQVELEEIALLRTRLSLRAPGRGRVEQILSRPNELLMAGQPLLTIVDTEPKGIVAYIPERDLPQVRPGMRAQVENLAGSLVLKTTVASIGSTVEQVPQHLWADPRYPQWGRLVHLALPQSFQEQPGTGLRIRLLPEQAR